MSDASAANADALEALPPLREVIAIHGLSARKSLGQNFLLDINLTRRIARAGGPLAGCHVVEVGPGPGGLTRALLLEGADHVTAIERDPRAWPALADIAAAAPGRLTVVEGDALAFDYGSPSQDDVRRTQIPRHPRPSTASAEDPGNMGAGSSGLRFASPEDDGVNRRHGGGRPLRIVANLPYNIATPLLTGWLGAEPWPPFWESLTLMFQREVAERIVATPGTKAYGRLAVLAQWRARAAILFDVPARAFTPPPKVTSAVVRLEPRADAESLPVRALEAVTAAAFGQRRKMLRSSLKSLWPDPEPMLAKAGIEPTLRAEQLPVEAFLRLARLSPAHGV